MTIADRIIFTFLFLGLLLRSTEEAHSTCKVTGSATMGPYFVRDQPQRSTMCQRDPRFKSVPKLIVSGRILDEGCHLPVPRAKVEVWQADSTGSYRDLSWCRSTLYSDSRGQYTFRTVYPGKYNTGAGLRPAHIHFMVTTPNNCYNRLITQLYFEGDTNLGRGDSCSSFICSSDDETLIQSTSRYTANNTEWISTEFDIVLRRQRHWDASKCVSQLTTESELITTPTTAQKLPTVDMSQELTTSPVDNCPDVNGSQGFNRDLFDFVFRVTIKPMHFSEGGYYRAKLNRAFSVPHVESESFSVGQIVKLECSTDCIRMCNQTLISKQSFLVAGVAGQLSNKGVIVLNATTLIQPWDLIKRQVKKSFNN